LISNHCSIKRGCTEAVDDAVVETRDGTWLAVEGGDIVLRYLAHAFIHKRMASFKEAGQLNSDSLKGKCLLFIRLVINFIQKIKKVLYLKCSMTFIAESDSREARIKESSTSMCDPCCVCLMALVKHDPDCSPQKRELNLLICLVFHHPYSTQHPEELEENCHHVPGIEFPLHKNINPPM
jgi:hypothetical protein